MIYLLYVTALLNVGLGLFTLSSSNRSKKHYLFLAMTVSLAGWAITNAEFQNAVNKDYMYLWAVTAYQAAAVLLYFVQEFAKKIAELYDTRFLKLFKIALLAFGVFSPMVPGLITTGVVFETRAILSGPALPLLFLTYLIFVLLTEYYFYQAIINSSKDDRVQKYFIATGVTGALLLGILTNLVLPAVEIYEAVALGPSFSLILFGFVSYGIVRHKLFDVRILLGRITYYTVLGLIPYLVFFLSAKLFVEIGGLFSLESYLLAVPITILFIILFNWFNDYLKNEVTTRLINPGYNPALVTERFSNSISFTLELEQIAENFTETIQKTIRPDLIQIVIYEDEERNVERNIYTQQDHQQVDTARLEELCKMLWQALNRHIIVADHIEYEIDSGIYANVPSLAQRILSLMKSINVRVVAPVAGKNETRGLYILGNKEAEYPYTSQDIDFLQTLTNTCSTAIERSLLYNEVQQFANTLQQKVDNATKELKQTNLELQTALEQVQEARRRERDMMDVMGHELRTPISIVRNALVMLERERDKSEDNSIPEDKLEKYLSMGLESARREIKLIETLLSATKVDAARLQLYFTKVDFRDVINDAIEGQRLHIDKKPVEIVYEPPKNEIFIYSDRTRIQEVIDNFLSNAVKYTMEGEIKITVWDDGEAGYVAIADSGIGIAENDLKNLGKKFFRAKQYVSGDDETQVVRPGGTGLGLYVTFELIKVMGGELYINSKVGKGTTFTVSMPLYEGQEDQQFDQTFDQDSNVHRDHITINGSAPQPPTEQA